MASKWQTSLACWHVAGTSPNRRLFEQLLAQQPTSEEFVYLRRIDKGPAEYNPYAMQVRGDERANPAIYVRQLAG